MERTLRSPPNGMRAQGSVIHRWAILEQTPLMQASELVNVSTVRVLVDAGVRALLLLVCVHRR